MTASTPPWCRRSTSITEQRGLLPQARRKIEFVVGFFALAKIKDQQGIKPCLLKVGHNSLECFGCVYYYYVLCSGKRFVLSMSPSHARCVCEE